MGDECFFFSPLLFRRLSRRLAENDGAAAAIGRGMGYDGKMQKHFRVGTELRGESREVAQTCYQNILHYSVLKTIGL